jgi:ribosomal protein L40E
MVPATAAFTSIKKFLKAKTCLKCQSADLRRKSRELTNYPLLNRKQLRLKHKERLNDHNLKRQLSLR